MSAKDRQQERWRKEIAKWKARMAMLKPNGPTRTGDPRIIPLPIRSGGNTGKGTPNWFAGDPELDVKKIKPMAGENEKRYPLIHSKDPSTGKWSLSVSMNNDYVRMALDAGANAISDGSKFVELTPTEMGKVLSSAESAAQITLGKHFLFVQMHLTNGLYTEEDADLLLMEQPSSTVAMQNLFRRIDGVPAIVAQDHLSKASKAS